MFCFTCRHRNNTTPHGIFSQTRLTAGKQPRWTSRSSLSYRHQIVPLWKKKISTKREKINEKKNRAWEKWPFESVESYMIPWKQLIKSQIYTARSRFIKSILSSIFYADIDRSHITDENGDWLPLRTIIIYTSIRHCGTFK